MYNSDEPVSFKNLEEYQVSLLRVLGLNEYGDEVLRGLEALYDEIKPLDEVQARVRYFQCSSGMEDAWLFMFSYDEFEATHAAIARWRSTGVFSF